MADAAPSEGLLDSSAIDELLKQAASFADPAGAVPSDPPGSGGTDAPIDLPAGGGGGGALPDQDSIEELLRQATFDDPAAVAAAGGGGGVSPGSAVVAADPFALPNFNQVIRDAQASSIDLLRDVDLNVKIELGRSRMLVEDVLRLAEGSVVELDKLAGDPVDVFVNDRLVARGEVLVLNDNFCVRVNEIVASSKDEGL
ncbi:MAG: Flagellar motor switch protein FliN [Phycisphaerales bacterium]|nr:Flagellar motor switch protein FliN [Phycisphaerales bacterium]